MNKLDLFLAAMAAEEFRRRAWVISAFSLIRENADDWKREPYAYRLVQTPVGALYVDPTNPQQLLPVEGSQAGQPPYDLKERVQLKAGQVPGVTQDIEVNYGQLLTHYTVLVWPFGGKVAFQPGRHLAAEFEELILPRLQDTPAAGQPREDKYLYVDEYLKFCDAMFFLAGFTQLCVPAATPKSLVAAPGIRELRAKLLEENKDRLHDPAVVAQIQAKLIAYDKEYLKGDPSSNFLINGKSWNVVRSKQFGMHGAEMNTLTDSVDVAVIPTSLSEGWSLQNFPDYMNSLRGGTFGRSAQTQMGGESVKWLLRASSNITVTEDDCGATLGVEMTVQPDNHKKLVGFSVIDETQPGGSVRVTAEDSASYIGRHLHVRSPMYCKLPKTDYCKICVGERLAANPTALSAAISEYGSAFLGIFMSAVHGKALVVAKMDYKNSIL